MKFLYKRYKESVVLNRFVSLMSVDILIKASSFILIPVYLKLLTQTEFGLYNYLISIVVFFSQILNFGLYLAQSKIYPDTESEGRGKFLFSLHVLLLFLLLTSLAIIYGFNIDRYLISLLFKGSFNYQFYRFPMLLAIVASVYSFMLYNYLLSAEKIKIVQRYNLLRLILLNTIVLAVLFYVKGDKVNMRFIITYTIEIILIISFAFQCIKEMVPSLDYQVMLRSAKIGFPIMVSAICGIVIGFGDKYFLQRKAGFVDLSVYYLAFSVANIIPMIFNTLQNIWLPIFLREKELEKNIKLTKKMVRRVFGIFIILSIGMILFIIGALYIHLIDSRYNKVIYVLPVLLLSLSIESTSHLLVNYITYFEQTYILPIISVILGIISITLNIVFISRYGLYGAAYSSLSIGMLSFTAYYFILKFNLSKFRKAALLVMANTSQITV